MAEKPDKPDKPDKRRHRTLVDPLDLFEHSLDSVEYVEESETPSPVSPPPGPCHPCLICPGKETCKFCPMIIGDADCYTDMVVFSLRFTIVRAQAPWPASYIGVAHYTRICKWLRYLYYSIDTKEGYETLLI